MRENDFRINFTNFKPNRDDYYKIRNLAEDIYYSSPSDSLVKINLEKAANQYRCKIEVNSSQFRDQSFSQGDELITCLRKGRSELNSKIKQWKGQRFKDLAG